MKANLHLLNPLAQKVLLYLQESGAEAGKPHRIDLQTAAHDLGLLERNDDLIIDTIRELMSPVEVQYGKKTIFGGVVEKIWYDEDGHATVTLGKAANGGV